MSNYRADHGTVRSALELATRAPSVHNSQPWRWFLDAHSVHLFTDLTRWLPATDPDGRDMVLSCGAALQHARLAFAVAGVRTVVRRMPNPDEADHLASLELHSGPAPESDALLASFIPRRRTDRRPYLDWPVPTAFLRELESCAADEGTLLRVISGARARAQLLGAVREAATTQDETPGYQTELSLWSGRHASNDGIPPANLLSEPLPRVPTGRRFAPGDLDVLDRDQPDGAVLLMLGTASDARQSQLRAGEALGSLLLVATEFGLATCPLTQPLEIPSARRVLRDEALDGAMCPQVIVRLGWGPMGPSLRATPRRPLREVIEKLPR